VNVDILIADAEVLLACAWLMLLCGIVRQSITRHGREELRRMLFNDDGLSADPDRADSGGVGGDAQ